MAQADDEATASLGSDNSSFDAIRRTFLSDVKSQYGSEETSCLEDLKKYCKENVIGLFEPRPVFTENFTVQNHMVKCVLQDEAPLAAGEIVLYKPHNFHNAIFWIVVGVEGMFVNLISNDEHHYTKTAHVADVKRSLPLHLMHEHMPNAFFAPWRF